MSAGEDPLKETQTQLLDVRLLKGSDIRGIEEREGWKKRYKKDKNIKNKKNKKIPYYIWNFYCEFYSRDEEFAKIRSHTKLNATFNNASHILIMQKLNHANISDAKISKRINFQVYSMSVMLGLIMTHCFLCTCDATCFQKCCPMKW